MSALIGIGGHLAAGKDAVADRLVDKHGFVKLNMSEPLHEAMLAIDPYVAAMPDYPTPGTIIRYSELVKRVGYTEAKTWAEVRRLLQNLGTEVGRSMIDEDVWVDIAKRKIRALRAAGKSVVITGVRFPNELNMIVDDYGTLAWVTRPGHEPAPTAVQHASEASVNPQDFDVTLENDSTLESLYAKADALAATEGKVAA